MRLKQSSEEYQKNVNTAMERLSPSVLSETPEGAESNGYLMGNWLKKNCVENDVIDASVENIISAIVALDRAGLIDWKIAPVKKTAKKQPDFLQTNDGRRLSAREQQDLEQDIRLSQERARRSKLGDQENGKIMAEAAKLVRDHSNYPHSRAIRERTELKKLFDQLISNKTHPQQVLEALQAKRATFDGMDITRPKIAGI